MDVAATTTARAPAPSTITHATNPLVRTLRPVLLPAAGAEAGRTRSIDLPADRLAVRDRFLDSRVVALQEQTTRVQSRRTALADILSAVEQQGVGDIPASTALVPSQSREDIRRALESIQGAKDALGEPLLAQLKSALTESSAGGAVPEETVSALRERLAEFTRQEQTLLQLYQSQRESLTMPSRPGTAQDQAADMGAELKSLRQALLADPLAAGLSQGNLAPENAVFLLR